MAPKRELFVAAADGGAPPEPEKRLRVEAAPGSSSSSAPEPPSSPRHFLAIVLVVLFFKRPKCRTTGSVPISLSQIGRLMRDQICHLINPMFSKLETKLERKLEQIEERIQDLTVKVDNITQASPNRHNHEPFMQEASQEGTSARAEGLATNQGQGKSTRYRLRFLNGIISPIYHDSEIKSESNSAIRIGIFDGDTMIKSGPLSKVKVEIVALKGDFPYDALDSWTSKQFNCHRASRRDTKGDVLAGKCTVRLINGEIDLRRIKFTEVSSKTPSGMFIIAARLCEGQLPHVRVQEAVMNPVVVQDRRNKLNGKSRRPKLEDRVHRLKKIANGGTYCKRLEDEKIFTVQDFLKALNRNPDNLAKVLKIKKECEAWKKMVGHAQDCCLEGKNELKSFHYTEQNVVLFFNCVHHLVGAVFGGHYTACDKFDLVQRGLVDKLKGRAYDELDALCPDHVMTETDNFPVPIFLDVDTGAGPGPSYMSNAMPEHSVAHQGITAVQGLSQAQVESSCAIGNNDLGPSSSFPHPHSIIYQAQGTTLAGQESSSVFLNDLCQDPLGGYNISFGTTGPSDMCQYVSPEDVQLACVQHPSDTNNCAAAGLNDAGIEMPFWPGNDTLDESASAHINMILTPRQLTITGAPGSALGSLEGQMQAPSHHSNTASQGSASPQGSLPPNQENMPSYGSF